MNALEQGVKVERNGGFIFAANGRGDNDFTVEDEFGGFESAQGCYDFGKIARERLACFGLKFNLVSVTKGETAEAVPFGLVEPAFLMRQLFYRFGFCRRVGRTDGKREFDEGLVEAVFRPALKRITSSRRRKTPDAKELRWDANLPSGLTRCRSNNCLRL